MATKRPTVSELAERIDELTEALQRERADAQNIRRRHDEQYTQLQNVVKAKVIRDILPVIDNCERLLQHISTDSKTRSWKQGVEQIERHLQKTLDDLGVQRIKTVGEVFDPALHEAVGLENDYKDGDAAVEVVSEELQPGYTVDGEVIRHAMVKVKMEVKNE